LNDKTKPLKEACEKLNDLIQRMNGQSVYIRTGFYSFRAGAAANKAEAAANKAGKAFELQQRK